MIPVQRTPTRRLSFLSVVVICGLSVLLLVPVVFIGCNQNQPTAEVQTGWTLTGQFTPDDTDHFTQAKAAIESTPVNEPFKGIRVDGTELNPIYGYRMPDGKVIVGWADMEQAQAAADLAWNQWETGAK